MKSNEIVLEITEKHFSCRLDLHGIIRITILQSNESGSIEDVHKLLGHLHVLTIDRPRPVLADLRNIKYLPLGTL
ncbi:MAG: hypothetical protein KDC44_24690, partial [Phaeodactylibacter sp.]|nr:hypothetical protein [Phaeodactylibacter sp.]